MDVEDVNMRRRHLKNLKPKDLQNPPVVIQTPKRQPTVRQISGLGVRPIGEPKPKFDRTKFLQDRLENELAMLNRVVERFRQKNRCSRCAANSIRHLRNMVKSCKQELGLPIDDIPGADIEQEYFGKK